MTKICFGRHVYGLSAIGFAVISFTWHDFGGGWQQIQALGNVSHREILVYIAALIELLGGIAIQWSRTARAGALALGSIFLVFALLWVPRIVAEPLVYDRWANFFEQFSIVSGALVAYGMTARNNWGSPAKWARIGYIFFGVCVISFMLDHIVYFSAVVSFTPKWIPPGQTFWAITTTIAFALAVITLLSGRSALLASRLLTIMLVCFGLLVWLPRPFEDPHTLMNWAGNAQNWAITGAAWIVADFLSQNRSASKAT